MNTFQRSHLPDRLEIPGLYPPRRRRLPRWPVWLWLVVAAVAAIPLVGVPAVALAHYTTSNPEFCLTCHATGETPDRGIPSRVHPSLSEVGCVDCHAKPGQVVFEGYVNGFQAEPERVTSNCVRCHADMRSKSDQVGFKFNTRSININHQAHLDRGVSCVTCHSNIAHDTAPVATNRPRMETCYTCHSRTQSCVTCHGGAIPQAEASRETVGRRPVAAPQQPKPIATDSAKPAASDAPRATDSNVPTATESAAPTQAAKAAPVSTQPAAAVPQAAPTSTRVAPPTATAAPPTAQAVPAVSTEEGKGLFAKSCAPCHGPNGGTMPTANLSSKAFLQGVGAAALAQATAQGKGGMPAMGASKGGPLSDQQIDAIVQYLMSAAN